MLTEALAFHIVLLNCIFFTERVSNKNHYVTRWSLLELHLLMTSTYVILYPKVSKELYTILHLLIIACA